MPLKQSTQNDNPFGFMQDIQGNKGGNPQAQAVQGMMQNSQTPYNPMKERNPEEMNPNEQEPDNDEDDALRSMKMQYGR